MPDFCDTDVSVQRLCATSQETFRKRLKAGRGPEATGRRGAGRPGTGGLDPGRQGSARRPGTCRTAGSGRTRLAATGATRRRSPAGHPGQPAGRYQVRSPNRARTAGSRIPRTTRGVDQHRGGQAEAEDLQRGSADRVAKIENTATMITAALVTTPALLAMPPTTASGVRPPPRAQFPDPAQQEHVVVHAQPEQEHEDEQRDPGHDRAVTGEAEQAPPAGRPGRSA